MSKYVYEVSWSKLFPIQNIPDEFNRSRGILLVLGPHKIYSPKDRTLLYIGKSHLNLKDDANKAFQERIGIRSRLWGYSEDQYRCRLGAIKVLQSPKSTKERRIRKDEIDVVEKAFIFQFAPAFNHESVAYLDIKTNFPLFFKNKGPGSLSVSNFAMQIVR